MSRTASSSRRDMSRNSIDKAWGDGEKAGKVEAKSGIMGGSRMPWEGNGKFYLLGSVGLSWLILFTLKPKMVLKHHHHSDSSSGNGGGGNGNRGGRNGGLIIIVMINMIK